MKHTPIIVTTFLSFCSLSAICLAKPHITYTPIDHKKTTITITIPLHTGDYAYKDYLDFSVDHPAITLSEWKANQFTVQKYDPHFKERKKVFTKPLKITFDAFVDDTISVDDAYLHMTYYLKSEKKLTKTVFPLRLHTTVHHTQNNLHQNSFPERSFKIQQEQIANSHTNNVLNKSIDIPTPEQHTTSTYTTSSHSGTHTPLSSRISNIIQTTQSPWIRTLLVFVLGLLLSLTPCIYPMIPITAGILQTQGGSSVLRNILLSSSYTLGLAITFSLLGMLATFTGNFFGAFLGHPIIIISFTLLLLYLAGSMLGLYTMYIPPFMKPKQKKIYGGSLCSAFCFGAVSGTIASPCVSPGLIVILSLVAQLGSLFLGFILLFAFGIGLSMPLMIIGSFSGSLNILPQTGPWMLEIKQLFGFLLVGMCLYLLQPLTPFYIILWLLAGFVVVVGITHFITRSQDSNILRLIKNSIGFCLLASSLLIAFKAYQTTYPQQIQNKITWHTDYFAALEQAQKNHKKLLVDIGTPFCSLCRTIDKRIFCNTNVQNCLQNCISVKIDASNTKNSYCKLLQKKYGIIGFPTVLLIEPNTQNVLKQWGNELYNKTTEQFTSEIQPLL